MPPEPFQCPHIAGEFIGELSSHIDWHVYFRGAYDEAGLNLIQSTVQNSSRSVAWDIGANVGNHTLFLSRLFEKVYSFEPMPSLINQLRNNVRLNELNNVQIEEYGLADNSGQIPYFSGQNGNVGQGSFVNRTGLPADLELPLKTGDEVFAELDLQHLDFVKIDVEGFEVEVLRGMRNTLNQTRPIVQFEWLSESRDKVSRAELCGLFPERYTLQGSARSRRLIDRLATVAVLRKIPFDYNAEYGNALAIPDELLDCGRP